MNSEEIKKKLEKWNIAYTDYRPSRKTRVDDVLMEDAEIDVAWLIAEVERLQQWVNDLQSRMYINCVYCGHRYGPDPDTPVAMADILRQHIEICPKHPLSRMKSRAEKAEAEVKRLQKAAIKDISYCAIHHTYPCEGEPCWACAEPFIQKEVERAEKAEGRIRELEEGLKPFVEAAKEADRNKISEETIIWKPQNSFRKTSGISIGDLCKAYRLLEEKER